MSISIEDAGIRFEFDVRTEVYEDGPHWLAELAHHELVDADEFRACTKLEATPENVAAYVAAHDGKMAELACEEAQESIRRGDHFDPDDVDMSDEWDERYA